VPSMAVTQTHHTHTHLSPLAMAHGTPTMAHGTLALAAAHGPGFQPWPPSYMGTDHAARRMASAQHPAEPSHRAATDAPRVVDNMDDRARKTGPWNTPPPSRGFFVPDTYALPELFSLRRFLVKPSRSSPAITMRYLGIYDKEVHGVLMHEIG
jgi:hypothetical protein